MVEPKYEVGQTVFIISGIQKGDNYVDVFALPRILEKKISEVGTIEGVGRKDVVYKCGSYDQFNEKIVLPTIDIAKIELKKLFDEYVKHVKQENDLDD